MASEILENELTQEMKDNIKRDLTIVSKDDKNKIKNVFSFFSYEKNKIIIPYYYSIYLTNKFINHLIQYPEYQFNFNTSLREYQKPIVEKTYKYLTEYGRVLQRFDTGFGKTVITIYLASLLKMITLILVRNTKLIEQWVNSVENFSDARIMVIGKKYDNVLMPNIIIWMATSINKLPIEWSKYIGYLVIDEAHTFCNESSINALLFTRPKYVSLLTATNIRSDGADIMLDYLIGDKIIFAYKKKHNTYIKVETGCTYTLHTNKNLIWNDLLRQQMEDDERNKMIINLIIKLIEYNRRILIISPRIDTADKLYKLLNNLNISVGKMYGKTTELIFCQVLIGVDKKMGTGFDETALNSMYEDNKFDTIILLSTIKDVSKFTQLIGRSRIETPIIYQIVDDVSINERHYKICCKCLKEMAIDSNNIKTYELSNFNLRSLI